MRHTKTLQQLQRGVFSAAVIAALLGLSGATLAAEPGDPARWYKPDVTPSERAATARKEAQAAYKEALIECAKLDKRNRGVCVAEAKAQLRSDLDYAARQGRPVTVGQRNGVEDTPAALVRRQMLLLALETGACATR